MGEDGGVEGWVGWNEDGWVDERDGRVMGGWRWGSEDGWVDEGDGGVMGGWR